MASVREIEETTQPPKVVYPEWLQRMLENPSRMAELVPPPPPPTQPWMSSLRQEPKIAYSEISSPGEPVYEPVIEQPIPTIPVIIQLLTGDPENPGVPIENCLVSTNAPTVHDVRAVDNLHEGEQLTDHRGIVEFYPTQGHRFEYSTGAWGTRVSPRKRLKDLNPVSDSFTVIQPMQITIYPECEYSVVNGALRTHFIPYG